MKRTIALALAVAAAACPLAAPAQPPGQQEDKSQASLLLATLVGARSPALSPAQKAVLVRYRAGHAAPAAGKIVVAADKISCTAGPGDQTAFACDLAFHAGPAVHLTAAAASEVFAALALTGSSAGAPFGPGAAAATAVRCTLDAKVLARGVDGGADCTFTPVAATVAPPAPDTTPTDTPAPIQAPAPAALLVAALAGAHDPALSAADKAALAHYLAGQPAADAALPAFQVSAKRILCTSNLHANLTWSCDLTFASPLHLTAAPAATLYAALSLTGLTGSAAMGVDELGAAPVTCRVDPAKVAAKAGGVVCVLTESE